MNRRHGRQRRKLVSAHLTSRSKRSLEEACALAGLPEVGSAAQLTEVYLGLLIEGVDFQDVGDEFWLDAILWNAPADPRPLPRDPLGRFFLPEPGEQAAP